MSNLINDTEKLLWAALATGDVSEVIEMQEKQGQRKVIANCCLPKIVNSPRPDIRSTIKNYDTMSYEERLAAAKIAKIEWTKQQYEKMGIKIIDECDDLFWNVELPEGWKVKATSHSMWNNLYDDKGRERASFFYKAAFYDRDAFINFNRRYSYSNIPFDNYESDISYEDRKFKPWKLCITDCGKVIKILEEFSPSTDEEYYAIDDKFDKIGVEYLKEHYPNYEDINAYWED